MKKVIVLFLTALAISTEARAADWPSRPIKFIIPWSAGGITDALSRIYGERVSKEIGQPIVFDYKPGAAGRLGLAEIGRAPPDGYTIGMGNSGPLTIHPNLYAKLPYNVDNTYAFIGMMAVSPMALAVPATSPIHSVKELIEASQKRQLNFGTPGIAGPHHLAMEMIKKIGVNAIAVHYRSSAEIMAAMVNRTLDADFDTVYQQKIFQDGGQFRILAVTSAARMPQLPDVPTFAELGYPDMRVETFYAVVAPAAVPVPIRDKLVTAYANAARSPEVKDYLQTMALTNVVLESKQLQDYVQEWRNRWRIVIGEQGIKVE